MEGIIREIAKNNNVSYEDANYAFVYYVDYKEGIEDIKKRKGRI